MKGLKGWFFIVADQVLFSANEGDAVTLQPSRDAVELPCIEIVWFKYIDKDTSVDITRSNKNEVLYFGEYCPDSSSQCKRSRKVDLKEITGKLTIHELQIADDHDYYYLCNVTDQSPKYELIKLEVYGTWIMVISNGLLILVIHPSWGFLKMVDEFQ